MVRRICDFASLSAAVVIQHRILPQRLIFWYHDSKHVDMTCSRTSEANLTRPKVYSNASTELTQLTDHSYICHQMHEILLHLHQKHQGHPNQLSARLLKVSTPSKEQNAALTQTIRHIGIRLLKPAFLMQATLQTVTSESHRCVWLKNTCMLHCLLTPNFLSNNLKLRLDHNLSALPTNHWGSKAKILQSFSL